MVKFILFVCLKLSGFIIYNFISRHSAMKLKDQIDEGLCAS